MKITKQIFDIIMQQCSPVPPEMGGIIGGHGELITTVVCDPSVGDAYQAIYRPNINHLNDWIMLWSRKNIEFRGVFHSHPKNQQNLSATDRAYIIKIMSAMPETVEELFFPIVIPDTDMYVYRARKDGLNILIQNDSVEIL